MSNGFLDDVGADLDKANSWGTQLTGDLLSVTPEVLWLLGIRPDSPLWPRSQDLPDINIFNLFRAALEEDRVPLEANETFYEAQMYLVRWLEIIQPDVKLYESEEPWVQF